MNIHPKSGNVYSVLNKVSHYPQNNLWCQYYHVIPFCRRGNEAQRNLSNLPKIS